MFISLGYCIVLLSVFGGFVLAGGHIAALWQPLELLIIAGAALGASVVGYGGKPLKATLHAIPTLIRGSRHSKALYMELFALLYELLAKVRKEGLMSIEGDIEAVHASPVFQKYPHVLDDQDAVEFMTNYLRLMVGGNLNAFELESLMDREMEARHHEHTFPVTFFAGLADGMPAFGIVAAVLGVVHTMASVGQPPAVLGLMIAHALVGTFVGILLAYGFVSPLAKILEFRLDDSSKILEVIKTSLLASLNGYAPQSASSLDA